MAQTFFFMGGDWNILDFNGSAFDPDIFETEEGKVTIKPGVINDAAVTIKQGGVTKGTFTLNQADNADINLDTGSSVTVDEVLNILRYGKQFPVTGSPTVTVNSQQDFDKLNETLNTLITNGSNLDIKVAFAGGLYKFNEINKIVLGSTNNLNISLNFTNKNSEKVYFISDGAEYTPDNATDTTITHYICPLNSNYNLLPSFINQDFKKVDIIDSGYINEEKLINNVAGDITQVAGNEYKFLLPDELLFLKGEGKEYFSKCFLTIDAWYDQVDSNDIWVDDDGYLHFIILSGTASRMLYEYSTYNNRNGFRIYNVIDNLEHLYNKVYIHNDFIYIPKNISKLYKCDYNNFIFCNGNYDITLQGLNFIGGAACKIDNNDYLIVLNNSTSINISNCAFKNIYSSIYSFLANSNCKQKIYDNKFSYIYKTAIDVGASSNSENYIINNKINNIGLIHKHSHGIQVRSVGTNAYIYICKNTISDFAYDGISNTYAAQQQNSFLHLKNNIIFHSNKWIKNKTRNCHVDGGAIYMGGNELRALIEKNIIYGYSSRLNTNSDSRGIYLDDGKANTTVKYNIVHSIQNGEAIDARIVMTAAWTSQNNYIGYNIIGGKFRVQTNSNITDVNLQNKIESNIFLGNISTIAESPKNFITKDNVNQILPDKICDEYIINKLHIHINYRQFILFRDIPFINNFIHSLQSVSKNPVLMPTTTGTGNTYIISNDYIDNPYYPFYVKMDRVNTASIQFNINGINYGCIYNGLAVPSGFITANSIHLIYLDPITFKIIIIY